MSPKTLSVQPEATTRRIAAGWLIALGLAAGFLSGLFGVGGGIIVVPILLMLGCTPRLAAGSSVAAILPTSIVGAVSYGIAGHVDWIAALLLAVGMIGGAQLGSLLLAKIPQSVIFWTFLAFATLVVVSLWIAIPTRGSEIQLDLLTGAILVLVGGATGTLAGVLGVGGGIIIVPMLMAGFGASDLIAKGTSLAMMVPGSISGTIGNARRRNVDLRLAAFIGVAACAASPLGLLVATSISPFWSNVAFSLLVLAISIRLIVMHVLKRRRHTNRSADDLNDAAV